MKSKVVKSSVKKTKYELLRQELYSKIDAESAILKSHFKSVNNNIYDNISALQEVVTSHQYKSLNPDLSSLNHLIEHAQEGVEKCFEKIETLEDKIATELEILKGFNDETKKGFNRLFERIDKLENQIPISEVNRYANDKALENMVEVNVKNLHDRMDEFEDSIKQKHFDGIQCNCQLENRAHEITTSSRLNDLWTRQKFLEDRVVLLENSPFAKSKTYEPLFERLENVEKELENYRQYKNDIENLETDVMYSRDRLAQLEKWKETAIEKNIQDNQRIKELERYQEITHLEYKATSKKPHKCPICDGSGKKYIDPNVPLSGYEAMFAPKDEQGRSYHPCQPCETKGIVWG